MNKTLTGLQLLLTKISKIPVVYQISSSERVISGVEIFQEKLVAAKQLFSTHNESYARRSQILRDLIEQSKLLIQNLQQIQGNGALNCKIAAKQLLEVQAVLESAEGKVDVLYRTIELVDGPDADTNAGAPPIPTKTPATTDRKAAQGAEVDDCGRAQQNAVSGSTVEQQARQASPAVQPQTQSGSGVQHSSSQEAQPRKAQDGAEITRDAIVQELQSQLREYKNIVKLFKDQSVSDQKVIDDLMSENDVLRSQMFGLQQENATLKARVEEAEDALAEILDKVGRL